MVTLIGANGAGKTTLAARHIGRPACDPGHDPLPGARISRGRSRTISVARGIVQVPEGRQVFKGMSVEDNLRLGAYRRRGEPVADLERIYGPVSDPQGEAKACRRRPFGRATADARRRPRHDGRAGPAASRRAEHGACPRDRGGRSSPSSPNLKAAGVTIFLVEQNAAAALAIADRAYVDGDRTDHARRQRPGARRQRGCAPAPISASDLSTSLLQTHHQGAACR